ncbi:hypothetical protein O6H91_09G097500 [Diphasiastrum complanatum]|uniref:Uncharacterized protein n=1 Tax=Diphasiastrum complanatum TaxID=34168 RepID=A0ACC2CSE7_DIPCM|nr:hypothetical protein O6H91_09G097500 [Diphasiastrum complanatum]
MAVPQQVDHGKDRCVEEVARGLLEFLNASPTPFHAVKESQKRLLAAGYTYLSEREDWNVQPGGKYFFTRNFSTIVAFAIGKRFNAGNGFIIVGAHTDSPCLKLKPISKVSRGGFLEVGVQTYGGGLWHTWFDRDLTAAGRVIIKHENGDEGIGYSHELVNIKEPILRIPTLAIHLDRDVKEQGFKFNTQNQLIPVLATSIKAELNRPTPVATSIEADGAFLTKGQDKGINQADKVRAAKGDDLESGRHHPVLLQLLADELGCQPGEICDFELQVCDTQPSLLGGAFKEFIYSGRLDNLCMSFCSLKALIDASCLASLEEEVGVRMVALFDHEEVGSNSAQGAGSPIMFDALKRITMSIRAGPSQGLYEKAIQQSFLVSADMAHCLHPNYLDKHDDNHQPKMHKGLVIKHNANQRYATNAVTSFMFREIAKLHELPTQDFVVRNDMPCGSTIGPILASGVGIRTVDVGAPQLSMHSVREMCGVDDVAYAYWHFKAFYEDFSKLDAQLRVD